VLEEEIAAPLRGRHLGEAVPEFAPGAQLPSCEAIAVWCAGRIAKRLPAMVMLDRVLVAEDATLWAECRPPA
jgi:hypothetical protein